MLNLKNVLQDTAVKSITFYSLFLFKEESAAVKLYLFVVVFYVDKTIFE